MYLNNGKYNIYSVLFNCVLQSPEMLHFYHIWAPVLKPPSSVCICALHTQNDKMNRNDALVPTFITMLRYLRFIKIKMYLLMHEV